MRSCKIGERNGRRRDDAILKYILSHLSYIPNQNALNDGFSPLDQHCSPACARFDPPAIELLVLRRI